MSENILLVWALLLFVAVVAGKLAYRFGAPALLLFLGVGMVFGLKFINFQSFEITQFIGMVALCIILFSGGMDTKFSAIKPILAPGVALATAGVAITAFVTGGFIYWFSSWVGWHCRSPWHCCWPRRWPRPTRRRCSPSFEPKSRG